MKQPDDRVTTEPVTEEVSAPPSPDHLAVLEVDTCIHCDGPKSAHRGPFLWCWERTTFFKPGPTRAQLTEALMRAEQKIARLYARGADTTEALRDERAFLRAFGEATVNLDSEWQSTYDDVKAENEAMRDLLNAMCGALENGEPLNGAAAWHDRARVHADGRWRPPPEPPLAYEEPVGEEPEESERAL